MNKKELKRLIRQAEAQGFEVRISGKGHILFSLNGRRVATAAGTASDRRAWLNLLGDLKRGGFDPTA